MYQTESRDRATIAIDRDVKLVLEFIESNVPADKLVRVATAVAALAHVLWSELVPLERYPILSITESNCAQQSVATESRLAPQYVGDDSGVAMGSQIQR